VVLQAWLTEQRSRPRRAQHDGAGPAQATKGPGGGISGCLERIGRIPTSDQCGGLGGAEGRAYILRMPEHAPLLLLLLLATP
jgi:hypothetical protein